MEDFAFLAEAQKELNDKDIPTEDRLVYDCASDNIWQLVKGYEPTPYSEVMNYYKKSIKQE